MSDNKYVELLEDMDRRFIQKATDKMEKKGTKGVFKAKAEKEGRDTCSYATKVMSGEVPASQVWKKRANFAKNMCKLKKKP